MYIYVFEPPQNLNSDFFIEVMQYRQPVYYSATRTSEC